MGREGKSQDATRNHESDQEKGIAPIAALFKDCLQQFERLCAATVESQQIGGKSLNSMIDGCFSKFRMWGRDTGAPDGLLDHALRKSSRLQQTTKDILGDLLSTLRTSKTFVFSYHCKTEYNLHTSCSLCSQIFHCDKIYCICILQCFQKQIPVPGLFSEFFFGG